MSRDFAAGKARHTIIKCFSNKVSLLRTVANSNHQKETNTAIVFSNIINKDNSAMIFLIMLFLLKNISYHYWKFISSKLECTVSRLGITLNLLKNLQFSAPLSSAFSR